MQDEPQELTVPDIYADVSKNLCNLLISEDEGEALNLSDSLYYTETDFVDFINSNKVHNNSNITIISLNIANLLSKLNSFRIFLNGISTANNQPDVIVVVETHLTNEINSGLSPHELKNIIPGYNFYHKARTAKKGGGVGVFVSCSLSNETEILELARFQDEQFENIVVKLPNAIKNCGNKSEKDLIVAAIYRQPNNANLDIFNRELGRLLSLIDKKKNEVVVVGDMNLDLLKYDCHAETANYLDLMSQHKFLPRIVRPTRIKKQSATLIDHLFTQESDSYRKSGIIDTEIAGNHGYTDHFPIFLILRTSFSTHRANDPVQKTYFTKKNHDARREKLGNEDWSELFQLNDPNAIYDLMLEKYGHHYHENKTIKTYSKNSNRVGRQPWMTDTILADIRRRDRLSRKKDRRKEYRQLRNEIVKKIRKAQREYLRQQIEDSVGNIKKHWKVVKSATNKLNDKTETASAFYYKGTLENDQQKNAENMNEFLAGIGKETNESVGAPKVRAANYLTKHSDRIEQEFVFKDISAAEIVDTCKNIKPKTSYDVDGIQQKIVLSDIEILAPVIAHLVNVSQKSGVFPDKGKTARVIPVYKNKGSKNAFDNYRPISLLPVFSKIIEKLIYDKLFEFLVRYQILFETQYGFRKGRNTTHATLDFIKTIEEAIESNQYAIGVFCDLSKAFDTLNHEILLSKLEHYGIRGTANRWFRSYLTDRKQYVELNSKKSTTLPLPTGVPQGSILGPLLFLIYINDLPSAANLKCVSFADDSNLITQGSDLADLTASLTKELEHVSDFFKANQLKLNAKKTKMVIFTKKKLPPNHQNLNVFLEGVKLKHDESAEFLGITIDSTLSWDKHCSNVANKISRHNGILNRVKHMLPPSSLKLLYHSFIQPHIQYVLPAWGGCSAQNKKRIVNIQKRAIRTITKSYITDHTEPRMKKLGLLKFDDLYKTECMFLIHDCVHGNAPVNIKSDIKPASSSEHILRSQVENPLDLRIPMLKTRAGSNSFNAKGPHIWNNVNNELRSIQRKASFKKAVKNSILKEYEQKATCTNPRCRDHGNHS